MTASGSTSGRADVARSTIIPSCTERDFFTTIYPYRRFGSWNCVFCGEPIEYASDGTVLIGSGKLGCRVEDIGGFHQLSPLAGTPGAVNRCCSDRIAGADE